MTNKLLNNIGYLMLLQLASILLPLLSIPYILSVIGSSNYGYLAVATAVVLMMEVIVDYGFQLPACKYVSQNRQDRRKLTLIWSQVTLTKLALYCAMMLVVFLLQLLGFVEKFLAILIYVGGLSSLGRVIYPQWLFQGLESLKTVSLIQILTRIALFASIFILINEDSSLILIQFLTNGSVFIGAILTIPFILRTIDLSNLNEMFKSDSGAIFSESWQIFKSNIMVLMYSKSYLPLSASMLTLDYIAYLSIADRYCRSLILLLNPIVSGFYPRVSELVLKNKREASRLSLWVLIGSVSVALIGTFVFNVLPVFWLEFIFNEIPPLGVNIFVVMSCLLVPMVISETLKVLYIIPFGMTNYIFSAYFCSVVFFVVGFIFLFFLKSIENVTYLLVSVEYFLTSYLMILLFRKGTGA
jgi:PST family polysaccharide transporter